LNRDFCVLKFVGLQLVTRPFTMCPAAPEGKERTHHSIYRQIDLKELHRNLQTGEGSDLES